MTRARDLSNLMGSGNFSSTTFTATAGQTAFTIAHTQGFVQVFMNGLLLDLTADYTSNGTAITLTSGAAAGDEIEVVKYNTFSVGDAIPASGGTFTGSIDASAGLITPAGHVVQVVHNTTNTEVVITSGSHVDTGLSASITPTSTSNKILVIVTVQLRLQGNAGSDSGAGWKLLRGSTAIRTTPNNYNNYVYGGTANGEFRGTESFSFLDSPATTSATTYKVQGARYGTSLFKVQDNNTFSEIVLMEIAQ